MVILLNPLTFRPKTWRKRRRPIGRMKLQSQHALAQEFRKCTNGEIFVPATQSVIKGLSVESLGLEQEIEGREEDILCLDDEEKLNHTTQTEEVATVEGDNDSGIDQSEAVCESASPRKTTSNNELKSKETASSSPKVNERQEADELDEFFGADNQEQKCVKQEEAVKQPCQRVPSDSDDSDFEADVLERVGDAQSSDVIEAKPAKKPQVKETISDKKPEVKDTQPAKKPDAKEAQPAKKPDSKEAQPAKKSDAKEAQPAKKLEVKETMSDKKSDVKETQPAKKPDAKEAQPAKKAEVKEAQPAKKPDAYAKEAQPAKKAEVKEAQPAKKPDDKEKQSAVKPKDNNSVKKADSNDSKKGDPIKITKNEKPEKNDTDNQATKSKTRVEHTVSIPHPGPDSSTEDETSTEKIVTKNITADPVPSETAKTCKDSNEKKPAMNSEKDVSEKTHSKAGATKIEPDKTGNKNFAEKSSTKVSSQEKTKDDKKVKKGDGVAAAKSDETKPENALGKKSDSPENPDKKADAKTKVSEKIVTAAEKVPVEKVSPENKNGTTEVTSKDLEKPKMVEKTNQEVKTDKAPVFKDSGTEKQRVKTEVAKIVSPPKDKTVDEKTKTVTEKVSPEKVSPTKTPDKKPNAEKSKSSAKLNEKSETDSVKSIIKSGPGAETGTGSEKSVSFSKKSKS